MATTKAGFAAAYEAVYAFVMAAVMQPSHEIQIEANTRGERKVRLPTRTNSGAPKTPIPREIQNPDSIKVAVRHVAMQDLAEAVAYALHHELSLHDSFSKEELAALTMFVKVQLFAV